MVTAVIISAASLRVCGHRRHHVEFDVLNDAPVQRQLVGLVGNGHKSDHLQSVHGDGIA